MDTGSIMTSSKLTEAADSPTGNPGSSAPAQAPGSAASSSPAPACLRLVVLISGGGSNLQALLDASVSTQAFKIVGVLSNKADAYGLERARQHDVATAVLKHTDYADRLAFDQALVERIDQWQPDLLILAGFMRILSAEFVHHYAGRLLNIHPSLLPKYKGLHTHQRALDAGDTEHGCSVHFVTPELDGGPVIAQAIVNVMPDDNVDTLSKRVHAAEHKLYPAVVSWLASGRLSYRRGMPWLDGQALTHALRI